jgi:SAM-dependent methyltransferase
MDYDKYAALWQAKKSSDNHYAHTYLEKPAMYSIMDQVKDKKILDLGCGSGEDIEKLKVNNEVVGLDYSHELLTLAKFNNPDTVFWCIDLNLQAIPTNIKYDYIFSSLTVHYVEDWDNLFKQLHSILNENGSILISTHHPIKWGSNATKNKQFNEFKMGYRKDKNDSKTFEVFGDYLSTYPIHDKLFQQLDVTYYNRSLSEMFKVFNDNGFEVVKLLEPKPIEEAKTVIPDFYEVHSKIPLFVIWELRKK